MDRAARRQLQQRLHAHFRSHFQASREDDILGTVRPGNGTELLDVISIASENGCALVPRGAGTSPFAGAVPLQGLIIDFDRLDRILAVDEQQRLATVQPGVIWQVLIEHLATFGLMPCVYPSSQAISTVGGFVAQGGVGIGSFQYGAIDRTVQSIRLLTLGGESLTLAAEALDLAVGVEGRTGLIAEITLRAQPAARMIPVVGLFDRVTALEACLSEIARRELPAWSVSFMDPAASAASGGSPRGLALSLPLGRYAALLSFREADRRPLLPEIRSAVLVAGGELSKVSGSNDDWMSRFMSLQQAGTTPIPLQFKLPVDRLAELVRQLSPKVRAQLAFQGALSNGGSGLAVRFFYRAAPRFVDENMELAHLLLEAVKYLGGEVYATGAYFLSEAEAVYGAERLIRLRAFLAMTDPRGCMNPDKAF
ncbi:MAG: FAD-binding oxidoreductase [Chloroflexota bacterium]|nr:FAD-binding oxidoreductase [Chloroflexota bacterium]